VEHRDPFSISCQTCEVSVMAVDVQPRRYLRGEHGCDSNMLLCRGCAAIADEITDGIGLVHLFDPCLDHVGDHGW